MPSTQPAARESTRNDTEERLLDAALTLFASKGYAATSVREIIEATGVTRPVLYYYFENKKDLFQSIVSWKHDAAYEELTELLATTEGTESRLRAIIRGTFAFCAADRRVPQLMFQTTFGPVVSELAGFLQRMAERRFGLVMSVVQQGIESAELRGGNAASLALLFCSVMDYHANALSRLPNPDRRLTDELADGLVDTFLYGVAAGRRKTPELPETL